MKPDTTSSGDQAIRELHEAHGYALLAYTRRRLSDKRDAEEAVQEVLVRAWRYSSSYDPGRGTERTWLFGIARNVVTDRLSKQQLRLVKDDGDRGSIDEDLERLAESSVVSDALNLLTPEHRHAIVASYYHGKTSTQIAAESGLAPGTVKSRIFYGLRALRDSLEEQGILR